MEFHFINVGQGNMVLAHFPNGSTLLFDCNVTNENERTVLMYLRRAMGYRQEISAFVNTHRDADHMRGVRKVHAAVLIKQIWDSGVEGTTTNTPEYRDYMALRNSVGSILVPPNTRWDFATTRVICMNAKDPNYSNANDQSLVFKIEFNGGSVLLTGDTSYRPWKEKILPYHGHTVKADILLASHHGSKTFFDDPSDTNWYVEHMRTIRPYITLVSVGPNVHGLPDREAVDLYTRLSTGSNQGHKVATTGSEGNMKLTMTSTGVWDLRYHQ